jgi:protocatechuate 3,4-dioxygenase beta subunit
MLRRITCLTLFLGLVLSLGAAQSPQPGQVGGSGQAPRDGSASPAAAQTGRMSGRVLAADTGRPIKRARVFISGREAPGGRGTLTGEDGAFEFSELPAGRYTVSASKSGFITLQYGQRRPLQPGTPLQLGDGQELKGIEFHLPRGGVITGRVYDEDGDAMPGVVVRVMRYQYLQGERRLVAAGAAQTDDRGQYRVWGLNPGEYYVSAITRVELGGRGGRGGRAGPPIAEALGRALGGDFNELLGGAEDSPDRLTYAPTYYPGVASVAEARPVALGLSQEVTAVDFNLQLVRTWRVSGRVVSANASPVSGGVVSLGPEDGAAGGRGALGTSHASRLAADGSFSIANVPPGRYTLRARSQDRDNPQFAAQPLSVGDADLPDLAVVLRPGGTLTGTVTFQATQSAPPTDPSGIRITAPSTDSSDLPNPSARVDTDGRFTLDGVPAGLHLIRAGGGDLRGWSLQSVLVGGRDVTDTPIEVRSSETTSNVTLVFTDRLSEISGTVSDDRGAPVADYTILAFSTDPSYWRPLSRHIMTTRPDQNGRYTLRGLPPGDYYLTTVDPAEQGEWFDSEYLDAHRTGAARVSIGEGDVRTQDFRVAGSHL